MRGVLSGLFTPLIFVTVALTALAVGLVVPARAVMSVLRRVPFLTVVVLNVAVIPLVGYLIARGLPLSDAMETSVVLCAICSGGPLALKASQIANADMGWSLSLTSVLLGLNVVTIALWSAVLLGDSLSIRPFDLLGTLAMAILLPYLLGAWLRSLSEGIPAAWVPRIIVVSNVTLVLAVVTGLGANAGDLVAAAIPIVMVGTLAIVMVGGVLGWLIGENIPRRRTNALSTLNRANSVALLVAAGSFADQPEVFTAAVAFGLVQTLAALSLALYWRWGSRRKVDAGVARVGVTG